MDRFYAAARQVAAAPQAGEPMRAVAVIPWRPVPGGLEVFLVERAPTMAFLPGFWTFPGGRVDARDAGPQAAAVRELSEETGIDVDPAALGAAGRWVTPSFSRIRFDAVYYLAELASDDAPDVAQSNGELVDGVWLRPTDALRAYACGELLVPSPIVRVLRALEPGIDGAIERIEKEAAEEARVERYWELADGVAAVPLRTPTLPPATHTGCYLLGERELVAVDPGSPYPDEQALLDRILDELRERGRRLVEVWLTHHHGDHVGGAAHLASRYGVPIVAHPATAERLSGRVECDVRCEDPVRRVGEREVELVHTPGHAPGHLCFVDPVTRFALVGDMVAGEGTILIDPDEGDMCAYLESLENLRGRDLRALLPAHGTPLANPDRVLGDTIRHRLWREERVLAALEASGPCPVRDLLPIAYGDVPPMVHPLAERSLRSHLAKLEGEGRARRRDAGWERL